MPDVKISDLTPATTVAGDEEIPYAKSGANGALTPSQLLTYSSGKSPLLRKARLIFAGDSKAVIGGGMGGSSWAAWALVISGVEFVYNSALDNCGVNGATADTNSSATTNGSGTATVQGFANNTNIAVITGRVAAAVAAGDHPVVWFQIGTNSPGSENGVLSALMKVINACRAAGAVMFLINEIPPLGTLNATSSANVGSQNAIMRLWCSTQPDCHFISHGIATLAATASTTVPFGTTNVAFSPTSDGVHESGYGGYLEGKYMAPQIARLFYPGRVRYGGPGDVYQGWFGDGAYPTAGLGANLVRNPLFAGTTGVDATSKSGSATVTGSVPDRFALNGNLSGTVNVAFSQVANDLLNGLTGRTDLNMLRMTISGTPTADNIFTLRVNDAGVPSNYPVMPAATYQVYGQIIARANALTGIQGLALDSGYSNGMLSAQGGTASNALPPLSETFFCHGRGFVNMTVSAGGGIRNAEPPGNGIAIALRNGVACSGSLDFMFTDCRLVQAFPSPMA